MYDNTDVGGKKNGGERKINYSWRVNKKMNNI